MQRADLRSLNIAPANGAPPHRPRRRAALPRSLALALALALVLPLAMPAAGATGAPNPPSAIPRAEARPDGVSPGSTTGAWSVQYDGFAHGLLVLKMRANLTFTPSGYAGELAFHTAGMVGWMVHDVDDSQVQGHFVRGDADGTAMDRAAPLSFVSIGNLRGTDRVTRMSYRDGSPVIETLTPNVLLERQPVPPQDTARTIDTLSAIAMLVRQVGDSGRCEGGTTIFDGRRLTALTARTAQPETLASTGRSIFAGPALRCEFEGNQIAGFKKGESEAEQRRTRHGVAWLASVLPHAPPVPVKVIFDNPALGQVTLFLTAASAPPGAVAANR